VFWDSNYSFVGFGGEKNGSNEWLREVFGLKGRKNEVEGSEKKKINCVRLNRRKEAGKRRRGDGGLVARTKRTGGE